MREGGGMEEEEEEEPVSVRREGGREGFQSAESKINKRKKSTISTLTTITTITHTSVTNLALKASLHASHRPSNSSTPPESTPFLHQNLAQRPLSAHT